ncbi:MAG: acyl-CoA thioesterase [Chitinophagales bacterium]|nr:acyl-CoA thioesterase [Chitinophagales bacterium]
MQIQELDQLQFPFPIKQQVYWGEMDAFNHINNVQYFRYFETGRITFFNESGIWKLLAAEQIKIVVAKLECNFVREVKYPNEIEISVAIKKVGNTSLIVHHVVKNCSKNNEIAAHGEGIIVATNGKQSIPWTDKLIDAFNQYV